MMDVNSLASPDKHGAKLLADTPDALRYDGSSDDPHEVAGMLLELMAEHSRVIDVGCGTGSVALVANRGKVPGSGVSYAHNPSHLPANDKD